MERYYALLTDGTLRDIGIHANWEAANEVEPQNTIWLVSGEDANQWREVLGPPVGEAQGTYTNTIQTKDGPVIAEYPMPANPVSMGVQNATMNLLPPEESAEPSCWRIYVRGMNFAFKRVELHPAVAVEQLRVEHTARAIAKEASEYLAIRHHEDRELKPYRIEYDASPEAMGQGATVEAHTPTEAVRIARWVFLIPAALTVTVRRQ